VRSTKSDIPIYALLLGPAIPSAISATPVFCLNLKLHAGSPSASLIHPVFNFINVSTQLATVEVFPDCIWRDRKNGGRRLGLRVWWGG